MSFIAIATFGENACVWYPPVNEICNLQSLNHDSLLLFILRFCSISSHKTGSFDKCLK